MYDVIKSVIAGGSFELSDLLNKIDTMWLQGKLTDVQRTELEQLARAKANPAQSYAPMQAQIDALALRVKTLEDLQAAKDSNGTEEETAESWPEYVQPTGGHDAYHAGDQVTYNGAQYICIAPEGVAVVWSPDVYPDYWQQLK